LTAGSAVRGRAPAKVNLTLVVGPPGPDGYHPLLTVFVPIDLHDDLDFALKAAPGTGAGLTVECSGVDSEANLVTRALRALEAETGWGFTGRVRVDKGIPRGGGLGGGSSDCAQALLVGARILEDAGGPRVDDETIRRLALGLGADVPFFLDPRPALATGVGELLVPLALPELPLVLVVPEEELSTAEVYSTFDGVAACESTQSFARRAAQVERSWRALGAAWASGEVARPVFRAGLAGMLHNDLERASMHLLPGLAARKAALQRHGALGSVMSGSGPSVFGVCTSFASAGRIAASLCEEGMLARPVRTLGGPWAA
jgi:4-diphosphocytidyl-2-C-methyl-D-erythritol kinase